LAGPITGLARLWAVALLTTVALGLMARSADADAVQPASAGEPTIASLQQDFTSRIQPFLQDNCYRCHANGKHKGDFSLDGYKSMTQIQADRRTWSTVIDVLRQKAMPPEERPQPPADQMSAVTQWIGDALTHCDCSGPRDPGRVAIHRLNRAEYNNTIRDLLGVAFHPADDFPADDTGYGFDNIADVLSMSPLLAEKYLSAAEQSLDKAIVLENPYAKKVQRFDCSAMDATGGNAGGELDKNGECRKSIDFVADGPYEFRIRAGQDKFGDEPAKMVLKVDNKPVTTFDVFAVRARMRDYTFRLTLKAGSHRIATEYTNNAVDNDNPDPKKRGDRNLYVDYWEITGPFDVPAPPLPESTRRIFYKMPAAGANSETEEGCARDLIRSFATRAFRRPANDDEVAGLMKLYHLSRDQGDAFEPAVKLALTGVLVSPHFLYRIEIDPPLDPGATKNSAPAHLISDYELATRLSYFLWSSMPDPELSGLAAAGKLREPGVIEQQVRRMLQDPKSQALVSNFAGQWLELRLLDESRPDAKLFPQFDEKLKYAMRKEVELFFGSIIHDDRSVLDLLDCDYTFLNERLAKHYGIPGVKGDEFRRVSLVGPDGTKVPHRGGVLEMAGVLTVTALPNRTSPVRRGKFILDQILGTPPPPPPADVPALPDKSEDAVRQSLRQRMEQHRADPSCAACHLRMDPIGFAMENFDAVGNWRDHDGSFLIDPKGQLPGGTPLDGPDGLKKVLLDRKAQFIQCLTEKLLTYALGRGVEFDDTCTVKDITTATEKDGYKFVSLVTALVESDAFQERRAYEEPNVLREKRLAGEKKKVDGKS
jgi:hypothetical protein